MFKRKERKGQRKLMDFFPTVMGREIQDGANAGSRSSASTAHAASHLPPSTGESSCIDHPVPSSPFSSPVKQKRRIGVKGETRDGAGTEVKKWRNPPHMPSS